MRDYIKTKGYLKIETLNASTREILDVWEDPQLIMDLARPNMAGLVAGHALTSGAIGKFIIGTQGHTEAGTGNAGENILIAKDNIEGFVPDRIELFSTTNITTDYTTTGVSQVVANLVQNEIVYILVAGAGGASSGIRGNYYEFIDITPRIDVELNNEDFTNLTFWKCLGAAQTATPGKTFAYLLTWNNSLVEAAGATGITADDTQSTVITNVTGNETTFIFEIPGVVANDTGDGSGVAQYSEAALFANANGSYNIFAMRCFPVRTKDSNAILKITWTIIF